MESKSNQSILSRLPSGIILGKCGTGKTLLYNSMCGTKHAVGITFDSLTINLHRRTIMHEDK